MLKKLFIGDFHKYSGDFMTNLRILQSFRRTEGLWDANREFFVAGLAVRPEGARG
jgi:hypothetical protein